MKRRILFAITVISCLFTLVTGAFTKLYSQQMQPTLAPIIVDENVSEVRFYATLKKPEHPAGYEPSKLASPNSLVNEKSGTALLAAALVAEEGVTAKKLTEALERLNMKAGKNIALDEIGKKAIGDPVRIYIDTGSKRFLIDEALKAGFPSARIDFVFLGNVQVQEKMRCGCLICGRSGPGTVLANSAIMTGEPGLIGPTLHAGLLKMGLKDKDKIMIIISKR